MKPRSNRLVAAVWFAAGFLSGIVMCVLLLVLASTLTRMPAPSADGSSRRLEESIRPGVHDTESSAPVALKRRRINGTVSREDYESALERMQLTDDMSLSLLVHGVHLYGAQFSLPPLADASRAHTASEVMLDTQKAKEYFRGLVPMVTTRYGVRCPTLLLRNSHLQPEREAHVGQLLATFAECGLPLTTPVTTESRSDHTIADVLNDTLATFTLDEPQIEWVAVALAMYLPPVNSWENKFGNKFNFDQLLETLLARRFDDPNLSCQGTHLLYSLAVLMQADAQRKVLSVNSRERLAAYLTDQAAFLTERQLSSGRWSNAWYSTEATHVPIVEPIDGFDRLGVTIVGHHLEWLLLLPEEIAPPDRVLVLASEWLTGQIRIATNEQLFDAYCPFTHAVYSLKWTHNRSREETAGIAPLSVPHTSDDSA